MDETKNSSLLSPDERAAELYLRRAAGDGLTEAERAELAAGGEGQAPAAWEKMESELRAAYQSARLGPDFVKKILSGLPPAAGERPAARDAGFQVYVAPRGFFVDRRRVWLAVSAAAALILLLGAGLYWRSVFLSAPPQGPVAEVARGVLFDNSGRQVRELQPGQSYRVATGGDVVLKMRGDARVRVLQETRVGLLEAEGREALRLEEGSLYASGSEAEAVMVEAPAFETQVAGVSLVLQETARLASESDGPPHGLVLVFRGSAHVRSAADADAVTLAPGELYVTGLGHEPVKVFVAQAEERARKMDRLPWDAGALRSKRQQYMEVIQSYRDNLETFNAEIAAADPDQQVELKARQERVRVLLLAHEQRLAGMPELNTGESPRQRARRLRRAAEQARQGQESYADPDTWL